jgi:transposase
MCNRFTRGRSRDEVFTSGCDLLLSALALAVCAHAGLAQRLHHLDTTSFALSGEYAPESDAHAILIPHGYGTDHRPDVQQAVLELMVSQDGGVPLLRQSWDGHASATQVFQERAQTLMTTVQHSPRPRYVVADCTLDHQEHAAHVKALPCLTRIPNPLTGAAQVMTQALAIDTWHDVAAQRRYQGLAWCHCGIAQRWLVVHAEAAAWRAESSIRQAQHRAYAGIATPLFHLQAHRCDTPEAAHAAVAPVATTWQYHPGDSYELIEHKRSATTGRPRAEAPCQAIAWQIHARVRPDAKRIGDAKQVGACYVLGTHIAAEQRTDVEGMAGYKGHAEAEGGWRFLKDPLVFVSSLCVKKPCRIQGLWMGMPLALLVYSVAPRRLRHALAQQNATLPNHINQPTSRPTLRWVLHMLAGIERVRLLVAGTVREVITGLKAGRIAILRFCGQQVCLMYHIPSGEDCSIMTVARIMRENGQLTCSMSERTSGSRT